MTQIVNDVAAAPPPSPLAPLPAVQERQMAIDILARTIWGEARGEPRLGKEAVAAVILNRLKRGPERRFGATLEQTCRMPLHFSCWNEHDPNLPKLMAVTEAIPAFRECKEIAALAVDGQLVDPTNGADHYHTHAVAPRWSRGKIPCAIIGTHLFFNDIA